MKRAAKAAAAVAIPAALMIAGAGAAIASPAGAARQGSQLTVRQVLFGMKLHHTYIPAGGTTPKTEPLTQPDDLTSMATNVFTAFQNGVGSQGEPSADGNTDSTVVEFGLGGNEIHQWDIHGKCDGLTADPALGDTAWASGAPEILFAADATADTVDTVTGDFSHNAILTAVTQCDAANAPATCPAPGFPPNYLGSLNP